MGRHQGKVKKKKRRQRRHMHVHTKHTLKHNAVPQINSPTSFLNFICMYTVVRAHAHTCAVTRNQKTCLINLRRKCLSGTGKNNSKCTAAKRATINELVTLIPDFDFLSGCLVHNRNQQRIRTRGYTAHETVLTEDTCILRFNNTRNCSHTKRKPDYLHAYFS